MNYLAASALSMVVVFAAVTYIAGLDYSRALRAHGQPGLLGFDDDRARAYGSRVLQFFRDALVESSLGVVRRHHDERVLQQRRLGYLIGVGGMVVSFLLIWPLLLAS